ncbi:MAG: hypothetical protein ACK5LC_02340 [Coprobacillaceae bacterium]
MKKIWTVIILGLLLVGCGSQSQYSMIQGNNEKYGLYKLESDDNPEFIYDEYQKIAGHGYVVQKDEKYGYIDESGEELIKIGTYKKIEVLENMLVAHDDDKITVFNQDGEELYKQDKKIDIAVSDLPIIHKDKEYIVLYGDGTELVRTDKKVLYTSILNTEYILVGYKNTVDIVERSTKNAETIKIAGTYTYMDDVKDKGYLLYDQEAKEIVYITKDNKIGFTISQDVDTLYFDKHKNIIAKKGESLWLISADGEKKQEINSYYQNSKNYVVKNNDYIYGPHTFYLDGEETTVEGIQLDPLASYTNHDVFPVFVKEKGYQYYGFDGKPAFETIYRKASTFDKNDCAIISEDGETYSLINIKNEKVSKEYVRIEIIGNTYYAGYTTENKYEIIDNNGSVVLDTYFMGDKQIVSYDDSVYGIFNRSGKSYIYDMSSYEEIFACEGDVTLNDEGYFVSDSKVYYSMKGEKIYSR